MRTQVLVVDDDADIRETLVDVLSDAGYSVGVAADGVEALARLSDGGAPDVILLDLMMPGMDGFALGAALAADPRWASVPVVLISAGGNLPTHARRLRAAGYLEKPMKLDAVLQLVRSWSGPAPLGT